MKDLVKAQQSTGVQAIEPVGQPSLAGNQESARQWYIRTTRRSMRILYVATVVITAGAVTFFAFAPDRLNLKLQIFNGAVTIPAYGGLWLASFILIWLVPMRELGFRGQESMERMESRFREIQKEVEGTLDQVRDAIKALPEKDKVDHVLSAVEDIPKKLDSLTAKVERKGVDNLIDKI